MNPYDYQVKKWKDCQLCPLCSSRKNVVMTRGTLPSDLTIIGEAPGKSEDALGEPFIGEAGKMLDNILKEVTDTVEVDLSVSIMNMVGCLPLEDGELRMPNRKEMDACGPRLTSLLRLAKPSVIIAMGKVSGANVSRFLPRKIPVVKTTHPAALLRMQSGRLSLEYQRIVTQIIDAVEDYVDET